MKTTRQLLKENYTPFKKKAFFILSGHIPFSEFCPKEREEVAHRIVFEFFVSDSLNYTYDETKGNLEGYFVSYTRLRIRSLRREYNKQVTTLTIEPWMERVSSEIDHTRFYEILNGYQTLSTLMGRKFFRTAKGRIPYNLVWHVAVKQMLYEGKVTNVYLQKYLKVSKPLARMMYEKLWEFINGKRAEGLL